MRWNTNVEYAPYVEYGTHKSKAKPFLRPAYDKNIQKMNKKMKNADAFFEKTYQTDMSKYMALAIDQWIRMIL